MKWEGGPLRFGFKDISLISNCNMVIIEFKPLWRKEWVCMWFRDGGLPLRGAERTWYNDRYPCVLDDWPRQIVYRGWKGFLNKSKYDERRRGAVRYLGSFVFFFPLVVYGVISNSTGNLIFVSILVAETPCSNRLIPPKKWMCVRVRIDEYVCVCVKVYLELEAEDGW